MKKILAAAATAVLAASMCLSFVACDGFKIGGVNGSGSNNGGDNNGNPDNSDNTDNIEVGFDDAKKIVSEKLTAEEWIAAFSEDNFKNCKFIESNTLIDTNDVYFWTCTEADGKGYFSCFDGGANVTEVYYTYSDKKIITYIKALSRDDLWECDKEYSIDEASDIECLMAFYSTLLRELYQNNYNEFEYSEEDKGYVMKNPDEEIPATCCVLKFEGKKLSSLHGENIGNYINQIYWIFTYGGQSVTLPTIEG